MHLIKGPASVCVSEVLKIISEANEAFDLGK